MNSAPNHPFPIILSAPSGGGKTTIAQKLLEQRDDIGYSVSCTTRAPREGEVNGKSYYFLSDDEFRAARERGEFAESAEVHGNLYGTLKSEIERVLKSGKHVIMDIDVQGAKQFAAAFPETVLIFILPPSIEVLVERLKARKTEDRESFETRLQNAQEEMRAKDMYHYIVINDDLDNAVREVSRIIDKESST